MTAWAYAVALLRWRWQHRHCRVTCQRSAGFVGFWCGAHQSGLMVPRLDGGAAGCRAPGSG